MELIGLIIFSALFIYSGYKHIRNHSAMAGYAETAFGDCPYAKQLGYLGGWPTGVFLAVFGAGTVVNESNVFAYGIAGFLALATLLYHRTTLADPGTQKGIALIGAALYIASQVA
jgi:uncharacterized membrane protein YphA (DoxX/SURF4 family)